MASSTFDSEAELYILNLGHHRRDGVGTRVDVGEFVKRRHLKMKTVMAYLNSGFNAKNTRMGGFSQFIYLCSSQLVTRGRLPVRLQTDVDEEDWVRW